MVVFEFLAIGEDGHHWIKTFEYVFTYVQTWPWIQMVIVLSVDDPIIQIYGDSFIFFDCNFETWVIVTETGLNVNFNLFVENWCNEEGSSTFKPLWIVAAYFVICDGDLRLPFVLNLLIYSVI